MGNQVTHLSNLSFFLSSNGPYFSAAASHTANVSECMEQLERSDEESDSDLLCCKGIGHSRGDNMEGGELLEYHQPVHFYYNTGRGLSSPLHMVPYTVSLLSAHHYFHSVLTLDHDEQDIKAIIHSQHLPPEMLAQQWSYLKLLREPNRPLHFVFMPHLMTHAIIGIPSWYAPQHASKIVKFEKDTLFWE
ncbi:hypothetical protein BKA83DRAFT_4129561 [Pisolithus microcarpus]|nr:hypothetical protein BKA83DRAFT_4129561 [Pisolithus microcarpus]